MSFLLGAAAVVAVFTNDLAVLSLGGAGSISSLRETATGRELVASRCPVMRMECAGGETLEANGMSRLPDGRFAAHLASGGKPAGTAVFSVATEPWGWTFVLDSVPAGRDVRRAELWRIKPMPHRYVGTFANASSDDRSFVALRPYTPAMDAMTMPAMCVVALAENGLAGHVAALSAGPRTKAIESLRAMTIASGAPRSLCGGAWSLGAPANRDSYLFAMRPAAKHVDDWIAAARRGGMSIVHFYSWFATRGHYEPDPSRIPGGLDGMKRMVDAIHAAGFKAGMHTFTGRIGFEDAFVRPFCSSNLISGCSYVLAKPLPDGDVDEMVVTERPIDGHDLCPSTHGRGNYLLVDGEIVQYTGVRREAPYAFTGISRGACGTTPVAHMAGAKIDYLRSRYQGFYPVIGSPLAEAVADNIARAWNTCGFDMIYLDGSEAHGTRHDVDSMRRLVVSKLDQSPERPILDEASCSYPGSWWFHSRSGAMDYPYWADKRFHDMHVVRSVEKARKANFLEPQLGWWSFRGGKKDRRHEYPDEVEYFASKSAGAGASVSILSVNANTNRLSYLTAHGLTLVGWHEYPKRAEAFSPAALSWLRKPGFETRLRQGDDGIWRLRETGCESHRVADAESAAWDISSASPRKAALRVEALYATTATDDAQPLLSANDVPAMKTSAADGVEIALEAVPQGEHGPSVRLAASNVSARDRRVAWAAVTRSFEYPWYPLKGRRALSAWVKGDGSGALLCIQAHAPKMHAGAFSDHYVRLDFKGWRRVNLLFRERDVEGASLYKWPHVYARPDAQPRAIYEIYRFTIGAEVESVSLMLGDVPPGVRTEVEVAPVRAVAEIKNSIDGASVSVNDAVFPLPFSLESGERAELEDGFWTRYAEDGEPMERRPASKMPTLVAGANHLRFAHANGDSGRAEVTVFHFGDETDAFVPLTSDMRRIMRHESTMPVTYAPARGLDSMPAIAIRPGERAKIAFSCYGPLPRFTLSLGDRKIEVPAVAAGERYTANGGDADVFSGNVPVSVEFADGGAGVDTRFDFVKTYLD